MDHSKNNLYIKSITSELGKPMSTDQRDILNSKFDQLNHDMYKNEAQKVNFSQRKCTIHDVVHTDGLLCDAEFESHKSSTDPEYYLKECQMCPLISDITGFSFGGISSRF